MACCDSSSRSGTSVAVMHAAAFSGCRTGSQHAAGTPHYMSPEIWYGRPYGTPADVWAVGCLLYELMTYKCATVIWCCKISGIDPKPQHISAKHFFVVLAAESLSRARACWTCAMPLWRVNTNRCVRYVDCTFCDPAVFVRHLTSERNIVSFTQVAPGKYSAELITLMQSMLQMNPAKRATLITVFQHPKAS